MAKKPHKTGHADDANKEFHERINSPGEDAPDTDKDEAPKDEHERPFGHRDEPKPHK